MVELTLLDYGVGNIHSLKKAFERAGAKVDVTTRPEEILGAKALLLPGVGAFPKVAEMIAPIREPLRKKLQDGLPAFCVCIGMQILYESSEEGPGAGLGLLEGMVRRLRHERLPHIGWNSVRHPAAGLFAGVPADAAFYFVHSFAPSSCGDRVSGTCDYGGEFAAAVESGNVWAVQFHPEKSSDPGLRVIQNFVHFVGNRR